MRVVLVLAATACGLSHTPAPRPLERCDGEPVHNPVLARVHGTVTDDAKHPVVAAKVVLVRKAGTTAAVVTDKHGEFALTDLRIGTVYCGRQDLADTEGELEASENGRVGRAHVTLVPGDNTLPAIAIAVPETDIPAVPPIAGITATATSSAKGGEPWYALGSDPTKFWCEGSSGDGVGEALVLRLAEPMHVTSLRVRAGVWRSPELFRAYNRITELNVVTDSGLSKKVVMREERENVDIAIGRDPVRELRLEIAAVAKGKTNDTCISGVDIRTDPASAVVLGEALPSSLADAFGRVWRAFAACDDKALGSQLQFPFVANRRFADAKGVHAACKTGAFREFQPRDASLVIKPESPGKVALTAGALEWHFVLAGGAWRLASLAQVR
jgi:hypothetical protein